MLILSRTRRIDWPRLVDNLLRLGMSMQQIADALGVSRRSLDNWARQDSDGEPAFWTGSSLIVLWCERTGLKWTDTPTRQVTLSVSQVLRSTS
jgi:transposase-like protein